MTVYLDYNATTPLDSEVLDSIVTSLKDLWGNPSSSYTSGDFSVRMIYKISFRKDLSFHFR